MANKKISELTELPYSAIQDDDVLIITDINSDGSGFSETKKSRMIDLAGYFSENSVSGSVYASNDEVLAGVVSNKAVTPVSLLIGGSFPSGSNAGNIQVNKNVSGSIAGGTRGIGSVDLQQIRTNSTNISSGKYSIIVGGQDNKSSGISSVVGGGSGNLASGDYSVVCAGSASISSNAYSTVCGGNNNLSSGDRSSIVGGRDNVASSQHTFVGGGSNNTANNVYATITGGVSNAASGLYSFIGGGNSNSASSQRSVVAGGQSNTSSGQYSSICGGTTNLAFGVYSSVNGGKSNTSSGYTSYIGGGMGNFSVGSHSSVVGGNNNIASGSNSFVGGGNNNVASFSGSVVVGGKTNIASSDYSFVGGGLGNISSGSFSSISGGSNNIISSSYSTVAGGMGAIANRYGMNARANGYFSSIGDAQMGNMILRNVTTGSALTELYADGNSEIFYLFDNETIGFDAQIVGRRTDTKNEDCYFTTSGLVKRGVGSGSVSLISSSSINIITRPNTNWSASIDANTSNGSLRFQVVGEIGKTINWVSNIRFTEIVG